MKARSIPSLQPLFRLLAAACAAAAFGFCQVESPAPLTVVSAASYTAPIAPASLVSIFGRALAAMEAAAELDEAGQLPVSLGGVRVEISGTAAPLVYVSPNQINFVSPAALALGTAEVIVRSQQTGVVSRGTVEVQLAAPGLFYSVAQSGRHAGAILNATTFSREPFQVETWEIEGSDKRTRLALYATGLRFAGNSERDPAKTNVADAVQAQASSGSGEPIELQVEYAGPAPGFFGLDQVNVILPPEAETIGALSVDVSVERRVSNAVTLLVEPIPADRLRLARLHLSEDIVQPGDSLTGTVSMNAPARIGGLAVLLGSDSPAVQVPNLVVIPQGEVSFEFSVQTAPSAPAGTATITASSSLGMRSAKLTIDPEAALSIQDFSVNQSAILGGAALTGMVTLSGSAPAAGATVQLDAASPLVRVPSTILIRSGETSGSFTIETLAVEREERIELRASLGRSTETAEITLLPPLGVRLSSDSVTGGESVSATLTLGNPAPVTGALVSLRSDSLLVQLPAVVTIPAGQTSAQFPIQTVPVSTSQTTRITAQYGTITQTATLTLNPVAAASLSGITVSPSTVRGGGNATGTVTLSATAPLGGIVINLQSENSISVRVPAFVTIPSGQRSAQFVITTLPVTATAGVRLTASSGGNSVSTTLTIN